MVCRPGKGLLGLLIICLSTLPLCEAHLAGLHVDRDTSTFRDASNRTLLFRGTNFVQKSPPYYPTISDEDLAHLGRMGANAVRIGVMLAGLFPTPDGQPSAAYLQTIEALIDRLWTGHGLATIIDLHQDVLSPVFCGEGSPDWMVNASELHSMPFPEPMVAHGIPADPATGTFPNKTCSAAGPLKFIGWSEFYLTDASGKAFQIVYDGPQTAASSSSSPPPLSYMIDRYWTTVAKRFKGHPGVLAYELLNEPWLGDYVKDPSIFLEAGAAEKKTVGPFMQRMHARVRDEDPDTPTLFSPAEINNRFMRRVGYEEGFLPGEPMAFHVYCITGTDGDGPTTPITKGICHFNDAFQLTQRTSDLRRLKTAGFVTEFGAVSASNTGLAEVRFVLEHLDKASPPLSWTFWSGVPGNATYRQELARPYPRAVAGQTRYLAFDAPRQNFTLKFEPHAAAATAAAAAADTEIFVSSKLVYPNGWTATATPAGCCDITTRAADGMLVVRVVEDTIKEGEGGVGVVTVNVLPKKSKEEERRK